MLEGLYPLADPIENAFAESDTLVLELIMPDDPDEIGALTYLQEYELYPSDQSLENVLHPVAFEMLVNQMSELSIPRSLVSKMRPWFAAKIIEIIKTYNMKLDLAKVAYYYYYEQAQNRGMDILELVSWELDYNASLSMDEKIQIALLRRYLHAHPALMKKGFLAAVDDWLNGNLSGLEEYAYKKKYIDEYPELNEYNRIIYIDRNYGMANRIEEIMAEGRKAFIVIEAGHMVGEHGIPNILLRRGYTVEQL